MTAALIQQARDIAADQYIRLEMKDPTPFRAASMWAEHVQTYAKHIRQGGFDNGLPVQAALAALRSIAVPIQAGAA